MDEDESTLQTDSQEIQAICKHFGIPSDDITGAIVVMGDGDYKSVKLTVYSNPWSPDSVYKDISWFINFYKSE